ncbi:MAG: RagB/SusD family nutrient uptake outer membrane protein [Paludibacteraceae bacterium]|nr:RagB/SusD family nutrient uptake outer membrane protein [Paludibacteraceae bacterium]
MKTNKLYIILTLCAVLFASCDNFLNQDVPQGILDEEQVSDPQYIDNLVISAYAIFISAEDINSSFSMWNFDVRSDDAYKGGNGTSDGDVFHQLEISQGILTTNWNINDMWVRLYNCLSRVNMAIDALNKMDNSYELKEQRLGEMYFLRAYGHFLLKRLYKNIPFVIKGNMTQEDYLALSNTEYTNDQGWQVIINDLDYAFRVLPVSQADKGRPTKASAAALLAKTYLYKAYRQDDPNTHSVTEINAEDLQKVVEYTDPALYGGYGLEPDFHNNFRPEPQYENGIESLWAMQYSMNDGTKNGNLNWSYGLIVPNIPGVTDGGCDFYKPSQNLVNAFHTDDAGLPLIDTYNNKDFNASSDNADPRLWLTVGIPGFPYMFNTNYMMAKTKTWSRSNGLYGYNVTLKHNVDPDSEYLIKGAWWGSPMNRIVLRYSDVMLMRAEALAQLGTDLAEAIGLVNQLRVRAAQTGMLNGYDVNYGAHIRVMPYPTTYGKEETLARVKMERRLELALESERFFDLVRWGEAETVINKYYAEEADNCAIYSDAHFTANKNEYLPIPFSQIAASNGHYTQNIGNW